jgi:hypothetical protein
MKKLSLLMAMFLLVGIGSAAAQKDSEAKASKEEMEAKKVAFITEKLALTKEESEKFWPVYNEKEAKTKELRKEFRDAKPGKEEKLDDMTDAQVKELLDKGFELKEKDLALDKEYNQKFIDIIGVKRTAKLYHMKNEFKKNHEGGAGNKPVHKGPPGIGK